MIEIHCDCCKTLIGYMTYTGPTGFFECIDCYDFKIKDGQYD